MKISHCVCHDVSFQSIKELSKELNTTDIVELQKELDFSLNCCTCLPYIKRTLATGEITFNEIITDDV